MDTPKQKFFEKPLKDPLPAPGFSTRVHQPMFEECLSKMQSDTKLTIIPDG